MVASGLIAVAGTRHKAAEPEPEEGEEEEEGETQALLE